MTSVRRIPLPRAKACTRCGKERPEGDFHFLNTRGEWRIGRICILCREGERPTSPLHVALRNPERPETWPLLASKYGLTDAELDDLRRRFPCCAICSAQSAAHRFALTEGSVERQFGYQEPARLGRGGLVIDHDHKTGRVRGLLCAQCNAALGFMADQPEWLRAAADYLESHQETES